MSERISGPEKSIIFAASSVPNMKRKQTDKLENGTSPEWRLGPVLARGVSRDVATNDSMSRRSPVPFLGIWKGLDITLM
jgi:hypothetical protein